MGNVCQAQDKPVFSPVCFTGILSGPLFFFSVMIAGQHSKTICGLVVSASCGQGEVKQGSLWSVREMVPSRSSTRVWTAVSELPPRKKKRKCSSGLVSGGSSGGCWMEVWVLPVAEAWNLFIPKPNYCRVSPPLICIPRIEDLCVFLCLKSAETNVRAV